MIKLIIFDMDGTLVDNLDCTFKAYEKACSDLGIKIKKEDYARVYGLSWKEGISKMANIADVTKIKKIHELKKQYFPEFLHLVKPIDNTINLMNLLKDKYRLCIATSATRYTAEEVLNHTKLSNFEFVVTSDDVPTGKPSPEIFLKCAKIAGVKPNECFVIEDSEVGIEAAKKARMKYLKV